jgi:hypothetical protein
LSGERAYEGIHRKADMTSLLDQTTGRLGVRVLTEEELARWLRERAER